MNRYFLIVIAASAACWWGIAAFAHALLTR